MKLNLFTLVEILVVIAIISILSAAFYGGTIYAMRTAKRQVCRSNLRQLGNVIHAYEAEHRGEQLHSTEKHPCYRFGKLLFYGLLENSQLLICPECPWTEGNRSETFTAEDMGQNATSNTFKIGDFEAFKNCVDYALANHKISDQHLARQAYMADGFHNTDISMHNHQQYGSVMYKEGNVKSLTGPSWMVEAAGADWANPQSDTGLMLQ